MRDWYDLDRSTGLVAFPNKLPFAPSTLAGMQEGDILLSVGGLKMTDGDEFFAALHGLDPNRPFQVKVRRCREEVTLNFAALGLDLPGANLLPVEARERLASALANGGLACERQGEFVDYLRSPRAGLIVEVRSASLLTETLTGERHTWDIPPDAVINRGGRTIGFAELKNGEAVQVLPGSPTRILSYSEPLKP
jgi:hypothetical protein